MLWVFVYEISIEGDENLKIPFHYETHFVPLSLSLVSFPTLSHTITSSVSQTYSRTNNRPSHTEDGRFNVNVFPSGGIKCCTSYTSPCVTIQ